MITRFSSNFIFLPSLLLKPNQQFHYLGFLTRKLSTKNNIPTIMSTTRITRSRKNNKNNFKTSQEENDMQVNNNHNSNNNLDEVETESALQKPQKRLKLTAY